MGDGARLGRRELGRKRGVAHREIHGVGRGGAGIARQVAHVGRGVTAGGRHRVSGGTVGRVPGLVRVWTT